MYVVTRIYNRHGDHDYLTSWCEPHGTVCSGDIRQAMRFQTREAAQAATSRAACRVTMMWRVREIGPSGARLLYAA